MQLPGRPIISGIDSVTSRVGRYKDTFFATPTQVINILEGVEWKEVYILATVDVVSLYTIITHQHGRFAVEHFLSKDTNVPALQQ